MKGEGRENAGAYNNSRDSGNTRDSCRRSCFGWTFIAKEVCRPHY